MTFGTIKKFSLSWYICNLKEGKIMAVGFGTTHFEAFLDAKRDYDIIKSLKA